MVERTLDKRGVAGSSPAPPTVTIPAKELLDLIELVSHIPGYPGKGLTRSEVLFICSEINLKLARWLKSYLN